MTRCFWHEDLGPREWQRCGVTSAGHERILRLLTQGAARGTYKLCRRSPNPPALTSGGGLRSPRLVWTVLHRGPSMTSRDTGSSTETGGRALTPLSETEAPFLRLLRRVSFLLPALLPKPKAAAVRSGDFLDRGRKSQKNPQFSGEKRRLTPVRELTARHRGWGSFLVGDSAFKDVVETMRFPFDSSLTFSLNQRRASSC